MATACRFFDPTEKDLEEATEAPRVAVSISSSVVPYNEMVENLRRSEEIISMEPDQIAGGSATRIESESKGTGLHPAGTRTYSYIVDFGDETLVASTSKLGDLNYSRNKDVLDDMMKTLSEI